MSTALNKIMVTDIALPAAAGCMGPPEHVAYVMQLCFWAGNRYGGPDFGRMLVGRASKSALRSAFGGPETRF